MLFMLSSPMKMEKGVYVQTDRKSVAIHREEAAIVGGKGRIIESDEEFVMRTQDHIHKYKLKLDTYGRDSLGMRLFNKRNAVLSK